MPESGLHRTLHVRRRALTVCFVQDRMRVELVERETPALELALDEIREALNE